MSGLMSPAPRTGRQRAKLPRGISVRCMFGRHTEYTQSAGIPGSHWEVSLHYCRRCWKLLDDCHAVYMR